MQSYDVLQNVRDSARAYEQALDSARRKQLGQFFSGIPLGKLLAHLGIRPDTRTVLDPMAGHGDLLDATLEVAIERGITLERIDGIEIDDTTAAICRNRLATINCNGDRPESVILTGNAFDPAKVSALPTRSYDLVITNPPYVRHQEQHGNGGSTAPTRLGLKKIIDNISTDAGRIIWNALVQGYSGLADLSVPAWILAAFMVRPGGRLALVVPATWRSRDYADVIRYLILRCFALEVIVADTQPGWFSDALIRTHLIVAKRLTEEETNQPLITKKHCMAARWLNIAPTAADSHSLVGAAFASTHPEESLATWIHENAKDVPLGIEICDFDLNHESAMLKSRIDRHHWYRTLEGSSQDLTLSTEQTKPISSTLPDVLRQMLPASTRLSELVTLEEVGIKVGQGLRTGCNRFFYVTVCGKAGDDMVSVKASSVLGGNVFAVPSSALRPVLHRQSEIGLIQQGNLPPGRVLVLHAWILPEDAQEVASAKTAYTLRGETPPQVMCSDLAAFVRYAATETLDGTDGEKLIPELSAVRTNARPHRGNKITPRFWYMLPDFAPRHLPAAFVPRINHDTPWVECNTDPPLVIDANFSTFWAVDDIWSPFAMMALLNSVWCRAYMEAVGTPLGGGALKLEATHLRQIRVPFLKHDTRGDLDAAGKCLHKHAPNIQAQIDHIVLRALFPGDPVGTMLTGLAADVAVQTRALCVARQRTPS